MVAAIRDEENQAALKAAGWKLGRCCAVSQSCFPSAIWGLLFPVILGQGRAFEAAEEDVPEVPNMEVRGHKVRGWGPIRW